MGKSDTPQENRRGGGQPWKDGQNGAGTSRRPEMESGDQEGMTRVAEKVIGREGEINAKRQYYRADQHHLVHDPNNSLVAGDVVEIHRLKVSAQVEHVVSKIVSPFGSPIESRPPIPSPEDRLAAYKQRRFIKLERKALRRRAAQGSEDAIRQLKEMDLVSGAGAKSGVGKGDVLEVSRNEKTSQDEAILEEKDQKPPEGVLPGGTQERS